MPSFKGGGKNNKKEAERKNFMDAREKKGFK